jgi:hypothetical protein
MNSRNSMNRRTLRALTRKNLTTQLEAVAADIVEKGRPKERSFSLFRVLCMRPRKVAIVTRLSLEDTQPYGVYKLTVLYGLLGDGTRGARVHSSNQRGSGSM